MVAAEPIPSGVPLGTQIKTDATVLCGDVDISDDGAVSVKLKE
ncbi:8767_t:CDS:2 [Ambispora gerdemannii]|uniref:8767_t:CDS:1 n=1 Tax=Ambispora gerdemannii TaxID=144530 RepID=A0A9N8ZVT1_9GLOM|nr:8767_t:CDS:2 [Ambispora gerdemannii]